jgi:regulatory protein
MSPDELEPAPREAVPVASFDDLDPVEPRNPAAEDRLVPVDLVAEPGEAAGPAAHRGAAAAYPPADVPAGAPGPDPGRERLVGIVDLDALEPRSPGHEAAELGDLDAPGDQATIVSLEDLRIRRSRRPGSAGRGEGRDGYGDGNRDGRPGGRGGVRRADRRGADGVGRSGWPDDERGRSADGPSGVRRSGASRDRSPSRGSGSPEGRAPTDAVPAVDGRTAEEQEAAAKEICLRLLTDRARSKHELASRLRRAGVADEIAEKVLERFDEVGLIDDQAFADAWVRSRHRARGLGRRVIAQELRRKGVAKEVVDEALTEVDDAAEEQRARELVERRLRTLGASGPEDRQTAGRRLLGMLARKGYPPPIAYRVVRWALAEHGADEDELGPADLD